MAFRLQTLKFPWSNIYLLSWQLPKLLSNTYFEEKKMLQTLCSALLVLCGYLIVRAKMLMVMVIKGLPMVHSGDLY